MKTNRSDEGLTTDSNSCTRKKNLSEVFPTPNVWLSSSVYSYGAQLVSGRHEFEPEPMGSKPDFFKTPFYSDKIAFHLRGSFLCLTLSRVHGFTWFGLRSQHRVLTMPLDMLPCHFPDRLPCLFYQQPSLGDVFTDSNSKCDVWAQTTSDRPDCVKITRHTEVQIKFTNAQLHKVPYLCGKTGENFLQKIFDFSGWTNKLG